jgi:hypothetical protein
MGKTKRKDKHDKEYRESLKKKDGWYRCRCERCVGANALIDKIAEKELKQELKIDQYNYKKDGEFIEDVDDPYFISREKTKKQR